MKRFLLLLFVIITASAAAQKRKCGTVIPPHARQIERQLNFTPGSAAITNCLNKTLSVNFIIVCDSLRQTGISMASMQSAISSLNSVFAPICLSFQICDVDTVYAYKYGRWKLSRDHAEFEVNYCKQNIINIALVEVILEPADAGGYAPLGVGMPSAPRYDLIVMSKSGMGGVIVHEVGHYFGLYHTFETSNGIEFVNGTNCATTGDLICDTPADIDPAPIAAGCIWNGTNRDPNNDYYTPMLGNIMSYHNGCPEAFTIGQYNRVIWSYLNFRNYLY